MKTAGVTRGCGRRKTGGIYAGSELSDFGLPIEYFLVDPPQSIDGMALTPIGVKLVERDGVTHVFDWVGSDSYPNVADFIEETRRFGLSRRLPKTLDFSRLTKQSRIVLVHARAIIENCADYYPVTGLHCPKGANVAEQLKHTAQAYVTDQMKPMPDKMCAWLWRNDIDDGESVVSAQNSRSIQRHMPSFVYSGYSRPESIFKSSYSPGIFLSLPITNLEVIRDPNGTHEVAETIASQSKLPVSLEDE